ncbi:MAG: hypothetical protein NT029_05110 [Armatimonadetes bacterium]|nr:hypothetical protein [Armatimonadota bacterium]
MGSRSEPGGAMGEPDRLGVALAGAWLLVPALQYFGTLQRTSLVTTGSAPVASLSGLDLTPIYALVLVVTILRATLTAMRRPVAREGAQ